MNISPIFSKNSFVVRFVLKCFSSKYNARLRSSFLSPEVLGFKLVFSLLIWFSYYSSLKCLITHSFYLIANITYYCCVYMICVSFPIFHPTYMYSRTTHHKHDEEMIYNVPRSRCVALFRCYEKWLLSISFIPHHAAHTRARRAHIHNIVLYPNFPDFPIELLREKNRCLLLAQRRRMRMCRVLKSRMCCSADQTSEIRPRTRQTELSL